VDDSRVGLNGGQSILHYIRQAFIIKYIAILCGYLQVRTSQYIIILYYVEQLAVKDCVIYSHRRRHVRQTIK